MRHVNPTEPNAKYSSISAKPQAGSGFKIVLILIVGGMCSFMLLSLIQARHEQSVFNNMPPAEHLGIAKQNSNFPAIVFQHLAAIPPTAPEYKEVPELLNYAAHL
jgi:hypothetical protein